MHITHPIETSTITRQINLISSHLHSSNFVYFFRCFFFDSVKTDLMENGANSTLFVAKVRKTDTGNYTCSIGPNDYHTIHVQVLNGNFYGSVFLNTILAFVSKYKKL